MAWTGEPRKHTLAAKKAWKTRRARYGASGRKAKAAKAVASK